MNQDALKYIRSRISARPICVDRLIVSSFVHINRVKVEKNKFIKSYLIPEGEGEEYLVLLKFIDTLGVDHMSFEDLIELFEFVISPEEKVVSGAVYTPKYIRDYIVENTLLNVGGTELLKICDPACGCSGFLFSAAKKVKEISGISYSQIFEECIYGVDIQSYSVKRSKLLLTLLALSSGEDEEKFKFNIYQGNSLSFDWGKYVDNFIGFSHVLGNPPYVCSRNIDDESKDLLKKWSVCSTGHPDLYIPFFEIGMNILKEGGVLGYITMNSFFKSLNGRALRSYFGINEFKFKIIDFGANQVFNSKATYTCICVIEKRKSVSIEYAVLSGQELELTSNLSFNSIYYNSLNSEQGWNLKAHELMSKIEGIGKPLGDLFKSRNGIATLKNRLYIFDPIKEDEDYYYLQNGEVYQIEKGICKDIVNPNKLINSKSIGKLRKKIIYPYIDFESSIKLIDETQFMKEYPKAYSYLMDKRSILETRDKGKRKYENWYAYGRNQSLEKLKFKLFFPHITPKIPNYVINTDENLLFHNGMAIIGESKKELTFIKKILSSRIFWFYIINSSRHYGSEYYSLSKNYFKNFGVYDFTDEDIDFIIGEKDMSLVNNFIEGKYDVKLG